MTDEELAALRVEVWTDQRGRCIDCSRPVPLEGDDFTRMHLAHVRNKRMWGDSRDNTVGKCHECHIVKEHHYGPSRTKPCPPKPKLEVA